MVKRRDSGHVQLIQEVLVDCDQDTVVLKVNSWEGCMSQRIWLLFFRRVTDDGLEKVAEKVFDPAAVYGKK